MLIGLQSFAQIPILKDNTIPLPKVVMPARIPPDEGVLGPSDAVSLFNGTDLSEWSSSTGEAEWMVHHDLFTVNEKTGDIFIKRFLNGKS